MAKWNERDASTTSREPPFALVVGIGGMVVLSAVVIVFLASRDDRRETVRELQLSLPSPEATSACDSPSAPRLAEMTAAFLGTVTDVTSATVTLEVDRWYLPRSTEADVVVMRRAASTAAPPGADLQFVEGERYLVSAMGSTVRGCGLTGVVTPDLEAEYAAAFG